MRLTNRSHILRSEMFHYLNQHLLPLGSKDNVEIVIQQPKKIIPNVCFFFLKKKFLWFVRLLNVCEHFF
jgi:hypothetical protein